MPRSYPAPSRRNPPRTCRLNVQSPAQASGRHGASAPAHQAPGLSAAGARISGPDSAPLLPAAHTHAQSAFVGGGGEPCPRGERSFASLPNAGAGAAGGNPNRPASKSPANGTLGRQSGTRGLAPGASSSASAECDDMSQQDPPTPRFVSPDLWPGQTSVSADDQPSYGNLPSLSGNNGRRSLARRDTDLYGGDQRLWSNTHTAPTPTPDLDPEDSWCHSAPQQSAHDQTDKLGWR